MSVTTQKRSRRLTLEATHLGGDGRSLTLDDLRAFMDEHEQYNLRLRSVTFELDDTVSDHS